MKYPLSLVKLLIRTGVARLLPGVQRQTEGAGAFLHYYSDRVLAAPVEELRTAAAFLEAQVPDTIDLALGSPRFDRTPSSSTKLPVDRRGWPAPGGLLELRTAIAGKLLAENRLAFNPTEEVLVTPGAAGALSIAFDAFLNPGDRVVLFDPSSPLYSLLLRQRRARVRWLPGDADQGRWRFRPQTLSRAMWRAKMIVINSPANPTGAILAPEDLEQIVWWANRRDVLVLSDEVFERYQYEGEPISIGGLSKARERTLTIGSLSKSHALASARVGWLAGCRHLVRPCALTAALQAAVVPTVCQQIALTALRESAEMFEPIRSKFASRRRYTFDRLQMMDLTPTWPAGGFFFWLPVWRLGLDGRTFAERLLRAKKVLVTPGNGFGPSGAGYVRISFAAEDGRLREGLMRLGDFLEEIQSGTRRQAA